MKSEEIDKVARALGGVRRGTVNAAAGYFGAMQFAEEVRGRLRQPPTGGRATDPEWTTTRLVRLRPRTLERLEKIAASVRSQSGVEVHPLQIAAILLERSAEAEAAAVSSTVVKPRRAVR